MGETKGEKKPNPIAALGTACCDCVNSKTKGEWATLVFAYLCFYIFMTGWMAAHIGGLVATMPEKNTTVGQLSQTGGIVTMGDPVFNKFLNFVMTTANRPGTETDGAFEALSSSPWTKTAKRLYQGTTKNADCASGSFVDGQSTTCYSSNQVRFNNHYRLRNLPQTVKALCNSTNNPNISFYDCTNPWTGNLGNVTCDTSIDNTLEITWPKDHLFPHIVEYKVRPTVAVDTDTTFDVTCDITFGDSGNETRNLGYDGHSLRFNIDFEKYLSQRYVFGPAQGQGQGA